MTNRALGPIPIDLSDRIAEAYGTPAPRFPLIPEVVGLALILLVNRNTSPDRALPPNRDRNPHIDSALCEAAEAFAAEIGDSPATRPGWRGGGLAGLREFAGGMLETRPGLWVHDVGLTWSVGEWLWSCGRDEADRAFNMAVWKFRSQCGPLAAGGHQHEDPDWTASLKTALQAPPPTELPPGAPAKAGELLGQQVRVTLGTAPDPNVIVDGQLLGFGEGGDLQVLGDDSMVHHCWSMLDIEPRPEATP